MTGRTEQGTANRQTQNRPAQIRPDHSGRVTHPSQAQTSQFNMAELFQGALYHGRSMHVKPVYPEHRQVFSHQALGLVRSQVAMVLLAGEE